MILQALTKYYDALLTQGAISPPGWCDAKVSYALHIGDNGELLDVFFPQAALSRRQAGGTADSPGARAGEKGFEYSIQFLML